MSEVAAREIAQCYEDIRERDSELERLRAEVQELKDKIKAAGDFVREGDPPEV